MSMKNKELGMTLDEFKKKLKLKYTFGITGTNGASRRYHDSEMNIGAELHTPRNEETTEWGVGELTYYFENDDRLFSTVEEIHEEYLKKLEE